MHNLEFLLLADRGPTVRVGSRVEAGTGEDYDTGVVLSIDGTTAVVAWDSGVRTPADLASLRLEA